MSIQANRLEPIRFLEFVLIPCIILLFAPHAWGQEPVATPKGTISGTVEIGGQFREVTGDHAAKFEEVRDVPRGLFVQKLSLEVNDPNSPWVFKLRGLEIRERDQRFTLDAWRVGKYRTQFMWDQIPHHFGTGRSFLVRTAPGYYSVDLALRTQLQALTLPDSQRTPANGPLSTLVRQQLLTAPVTEVRLRRDHALIRQSFQVTKNVEVYGQFSWLRNRGTRPMSAGTFVRRAQAGNGLADIGGIWEGVGQEFLEPIDQRTTDIKLGVQFGGKKWQAGVEYDLSFFRNRIPTLTFENPFRITNEEGCLPPQPPQTCGATNRFRTVQWQSDLPPDNESHAIRFWARVDITPRTQVRGVYSIAILTQNDAFLPWTLNTAITPIHWDAQTTVTNPRDINQLPARSANAKMRNVNQEYALVNRHDTFRFQTKYRSQFLDNQTPQLIFPGYAAFGDSTWRAARTDFFNLPIENLDWDFRRQNIDAGFEWKAFEHLTWKVDYGWEIWNRKFRDVNRSNEHSVRTRLEFEDNITGKTHAETHAAAAPMSVTMLRVKLDYRLADRRPQAYNTQPLTYCPTESTTIPPPVGGCPPAFALVNNVLVRVGAPPGGRTDSWVVTPQTIMNPGVPTEFNLLRRYDEDGRLRHDGRLSLELLKGPNTSLSASYRYLRDNYDGGFYGRTFNRSSFVDAEFSHIFESGAFFFVNYSRETNRYGYRDLSHLLPAANPAVQGIFAQFPIANTWERNSRNNLDSVQFGLNVAPQEGTLQNWQFDLGYALSFFRERIGTTNPFAPRLDSVIHAGANPYPDVVIRRHNVNAAITRRVNDQYEVGVRYWYEPYSQDDYSFNTLQPYVHGTVTSDAPKYMFQDARFGTYHANVVTAFLRYSF